MKKIIFTFCLLLNFSAYVFGCSPGPWQSFCELMESPDQIFSARIAEIFDNGVSIEILEVFKGSENQQIITVWDGETGDCNGAPITAFTSDYGTVGDTLFCSFFEKIKVPVLEWDIIGDYRKPGNLFGYFDFKKVDNNLVSIEGQDYDYDTYTYDELVSFLYSGECFSNISEEGVCEGVVNPLELPWLQGSILNYYNGCIVDSVVQFEANGETYFQVTSEGCQFTYDYYDCSGGIICLSGPFFDACIESLQETASASGILIWSNSPVCELPLDTGSPLCNAEIPRYYYNSEAQDCLQFGYSGCGGNANNYETYEVCMEACGNENSCVINNPLNMPWLAELIEYADGCEEGSVEQFSYNGSDYIKVNPYYQFPYYYCPTDLPVKVLDCTGNLVCTIGGYGLQLKNDFDECEEAFTIASNSATLLWTYEDNCNNLQFDYVTSDCDNCCDETLNYVISGGDGNYEVTTLEGVEVYNGMPIDMPPYINENTVLVVTDGQGCRAEQFFEPDLYCCEAPANCSISELSYYCLGGLQINSGDRECLSNATFTDEAGNSYQIGDRLANGTYSLTSTGFPIWPPCASYEVIVNCNEECIDPLQLELVQNAMGGCTDAIYAFTYQNQTYVYVNQICEAVDGSNVLYNCNNDETCYLGGFSGPMCDSSLFFEIVDLINEENLIWSPPCNYEFSGTVISTNNSFIIELTNGEYIKPRDTDFVFYDEQQVELSYIEYPYDNQVKVICIREVEETNTNLFETYSWLNNLVNLEACATGTTISAYDYNGSFTFIKINWPNGNGDLYFQDGTFYCSDAPGFSCLGLYNLTEPINSFTCEDNINEDITVNLDNLTCTNNGNFTIEVSATGAVNGNYVVYDLYGDDLIDTIFFTEGEPIIYEGNTADAENGVYLIYVYDRDIIDNVADIVVEINVAECSTGTDNELFQKYTWLNNLINAGNCGLGDRITEYDLGSYSFVFVEDSEGGKLYFEDGTFYCASAPGYDCVALYGFNTPTANWTCGNPTEGCIVEDPFSLTWLQTLIENGRNNLCGIKEISVFQFDGSTYFTADTGPTYPYCPTDVYGRSIYNCVGDIVCSFSFCCAELNEPCIFDTYTITDIEVIWNYYQDDVFTTYPWLSTLVDPINCNNASIQVYAYDSFQFISIENNEGINLYFQDGTFYCADGLNYSCTQLYGLEALEDEWICEGANQKQDLSFTKETSPKIDFNVEFKTYPNPSNGQFTVEFDQNDNQLNQLKIIDIAGKLIQSIKVEPSQKQMAINLANIDKGVYSIQLQNNNTIMQTQRIIIQ